MKTANLTELYIAFSNAVPCSAFLSVTSIIRLSSLNNERSNMPE